MIMSREDYINKVRSHLDDRDYYLKLDGDPTQRFAQEIKEVLIEMANRYSIPKDTISVLVPEETKVSRFYILPKIHKPGCPGRPIVSSCGSPTEGISKFIDFHLSPLVSRIPSHIKDTTDFLKKSEGLGNLPSGTILVTLDVKALYTNIPHDEGVEACRAMLNTREVQQPPTDDLVHLIKLVLSKNNFTFDDEHYLQMHGTAMGTRMAPSYANIFMGRLEDLLLERVTRRPSVWWRFIDDVFAIWQHGEECLKTFLQQINSMHPTIKFTAEWSYRSVSFLDVNVTLNEDGRITTDLYTKPTDTHQYLHRQSCHPRHCKTTIAYSQALRLRRICSSDEDYLRRVEELKLYLVNRGHDERRYNAK